ncbi:MAG: tRNA lysidine(34) synthetase TilS [Lachnospiraceae bacterium]|nr:tRNA lysidine(34) synthetase TilS [Lachnospiraceae bacterium]
MNRTIIDKAVSYLEANNMVTDGDRIVVGVSGGADSVCLLFLLCGLREKYSLGIHAVHINHSIREEAGEDAAFVERLCEKLNVSCDVIKKDVPVLAKEWKMSEEEAGRKARYDVFEQVAHRYGCSKIAVAHNMNDEAETVLFHMFRGSGLHGLTGIPAVREHEDLEIIRPIKCLNREEIETVLKDEGLDWVTDRTNFEDKYARNRIRHNILPEAEGIASGAVKHICEAAAQLAETEQLLEELESDCLNKCCIGRNGSDNDLKSSNNCNRESATESTFEISLDAIALAKYHPVIRKRAILSCLKKLCGGGKDIGAVQVEQVNELVERAGNRDINLARGISARRSYDTVVMFAPDKNLQSDATDLHKDNALGSGMEAGVQIEVIQAGEDGADTAKILETVCREDELNKYTKWLDYGKIDGRLEVRTRKSGDYLMVCDASGEYHRKSLKDYMIDMKIPSAKRDSIPVVACGSHCVWLVGYRISDFCKLTPDTKQVVKLSFNNNSL